MAQMPSVAQSGSSSLELGMQYLEEEMEYIFEGNQSVSLDFQYYYLWVEPVGKMFWSLALMYYLVNVRVLLKHGRSTILHPIVPLVVAVIIHIPSCCANVLHLKSLRISPHLASGVTFSVRRLHCILLSHSSSAWSWMPCFNVVWYVAPPNIDYLIYICFFYFYLLWWRSGVYFIM
jgi:hypothetical protein